MSESVIQNIIESVLAKMSIQQGFFKSKLGVKHALKTREHSTGTTLVKSLQIIITKHGAGHSILVLVNL